MKHVYSSSDSAEAHMLMQRLKEEGIYASIAGEGLMGAVGGLPADDYIKILVVDDDYKKARKLIAEWSQPGKAKKTATVKPASFAMPKEMRPPPTMLRERAFAFMVIALLAGIAVGYAIKYGEAPEIQDRYGTESKMELDQDSDGKIDSTYYYEGWKNRFPQKVVSDRNFDGTMDMESVMDGQGILLSDKADNDFNGSFETIDSYDKGLLHKSEIDMDGDGKADIICDYSQGMLTEKRFIDGVSGKAAKVEHYQNFLLYSADFDADGNGSLETHYRYDKYGEVSERNTDKQT